ncbi:MAG: helix-turn-helix domain-containing protein [Thermodesulfobacteriota bacterium]
MARPLRLQFPDAWYHIMNRGRRGFFNEPRDVAIYLIRNLRCDPLGEIGKSFGIQKYSTVSSAIQRVQGLTQRKAEFRKRIEDLTDLVSKGQRQT